MLLPTSLPRHLTNLFALTGLPFHCQDKCGGRVGEIWPYVKTEIKPTLEELGILTPEEMGYDAPELACDDVYDMHA